MPFSTPNYGKTKEIATTQSSQHCEECVSPCIVKVRRFHSLRSSVCMIQLNHNFTLKGPLKIQLGRKKATKKTPCICEYMSKQSGHKGGPLFMWLHDEDDNMQDRDGNVDTWVHVWTSLHCLVAMEEVINIMCRQSFHIVSMRAQ